ncbi:hypothetical protein [Desulforamulus hydrothermalis]|uniref:hypothetical protein n=1 Tax=Desulforamulus hydrothermalis TaxID=412895 RepID=UPI0003084D5D|nr:hypothetical protein [Desulforamulus hydrothermalis]SHH37884.1 hypothetical protein SAMN02745177_02360 [Desulforamulus hydrothermalis Lam5 = DSM 18033]
MFNRRNWRGRIIYGGYLAALAAIWYAVEITVFSAAAGLSLALCLGAVMAVVWPRW